MHGSTDMNVQDGSYPRTEGKDWTTKPEAVEVELSSNSPRNIRTDIRNKISPIRTPNPILRHKTSPLRDRKPANVFFTSAISAETQKNIIFSIRKSSDDDRIELAQATPGRLSSKTISRPRVGMRGSEDRTIATRDQGAPAKIPIPKRNANDTYFDREGTRLYSGRHHELR